MRELTERQDRILYTAANAFVAAVFLCILILSIGSQLDLMETLRVMTDGFDELQEKAKDLPFPWNETESIRNEVDQTTMLLLLLFLASLNVALILAGLFGTIAYSAQAVLYWLGKTTDQRIETLEDQVRAIKERKP